MPSADAWYHIICANRLPGESIEACEHRLRHFVATGEKVKYNWVGEAEIT
jgi:hypothetical protein